MRVAALDLGANTLRLLVAEVEGSRWRAVARGLATPRLGRGVDRSGRLDPQAKQQARETARRYVDTARAHGARRIGLAATSACRRAADGAQFVAGLGGELGLSWARVLSGEEEARLSRLGVLSRLEGEAAGAWLADVGGGSTELIPLEGEDAAGLSLELGAVRLGEAHLHHDPPTASELAALEGAVSRALQPVQRLPVRRLVATAGTAATLAALRLGLREYRPEEMNNLPVSRRELEDEYRRLAALPLSRRRELLALEPQRADIIVAGLAILRGLADLWGLDRLVTMDAGLLEGIALAVAGGERG